MPKPPLKEPYATLAADMAKTFEAGLREWRPDLKYPQSASDVEGGMMALLRMFKIERRPIGLSLTDIVEKEER